MPSTTSNLALPYPLLGDSADIEQAVKPLADALDVLYSETTAAARPAAGKKSRLHRATDTGVFSVDTGAAWVAINTTMTGSGTYSGRPSVAGLPSGFTYYATDLNASWRVVSSTWVREGTQPGTYVGSASATAPLGSVLADGAVVSRTGLYTELFGVIGTAFGVGNGSTTFGLPDLRGRTLFGVDGAAARLAANDALGNVGGAETTTLTTAQIPGHTHGSGTLVTPREPTGLPVPSGSPYATIHGVDVDGGTAGTTNVAGNTGSTGGGGSHSNMPPYLVGNWFIKL